MNKQEQIDEMAKIVDEMYNVYTTTADDIAEGLYNAGYRKTFTSDLASDTQKAFKEGYIKATLDRGNEIAELNAENAMLKIKYEALKAGKSVASSIAQIPNEINERIIKSKAVKEFAEKLKERCHNYYPSIDHYCCSVKAVSVKDIDELLQDYEK